MTQTGVYAKSGDLSEEEIQEIDLGFFTEANVTSAEQGTVVYVVENGEYADNRTEALVILGINGRYRYLTEEPETGETLTGTYLSGVTNADNATASSSGSLSSSFSFSTEDSAGAALYAACGYCRTETEITWTYTLAATADCMYFARTTVTETAYFDAVGEEVFPDGGAARATATETERLFGIRSGSAFLAFSWDADALDWDTSSCSIVSCASWGAFLYDTVLCGMDHTYFVKTSSGFMVPEKNLGACMLQMLAGAGASFEEEDGVSAEGSYKCTGSDGLLTKVTSDVTLTLAGTGETEEDPASYETVLELSGSVRIGSVGTTYLSAGAYGLEL